MMLLKNENYWPGMLAGWMNEDLMPNLSPRVSVAAPAVNIKETEKAYELEMAMPGMGREDVRLRLDHNDCLVISVEKKSETCEGDGEAAACTKTKTDAASAEASGATTTTTTAPVRYLRREFSHVKFQKSFIVPDNVDKTKISAKAEHGVLMVELPKMSEEDRQKNDRAIEIH